MLRLSDDTALLCAVVGMPSPETFEIIQLHGRDDLSEALTNELGEVQA